MSISDEQRAIVTLNAVSKSYQRGNQPVPVLEEISFEIARGEFLALMGPSGSGKSTLLNLIAGIDTVDSGSIVIDGVDIATLNEGELAQWRAANVGFIFQFYNLIPTLSARENIEIPLQFKGTERRARRERALRIQHQHADGVLRHFGAVQRGKGLRRQPLGRQRLQDQ